MRSLSSSWSLMPWTKSRQRYKNSLSLGEQKAGSVIFFLFIFQVYFFHLKSVTKFDEYAKCMYKIIIFVWFIVFRAISHTSAYLILLISLSDNYFLNEVDEKEVVTPTTHTQHTTCTHTSRAHTACTTHITHIQHTTYTHHMHVCHMYTHHTPRVHMHTHSTHTHTRHRPHVHTHTTHHMDLLSHAHMHTYHMHMHHMHTCRHDTRTYNTHHMYTRTSHARFLVLPSHSPAASTHFSSLLLNRLILIVFATVLGKC